jgi:undecaprenyl diphosphate synthase
MITVDGIDPTRIPDHIACVMDGNGRWAQARGLKRTDGHAAGEEAIIDTISGAAELGVRWLTLYAFSTENWTRPASEVAFLMRLNESILVRRVDEFDERNIRIRFIGRTDRRLPATLLKTMQRSVARTAGNTGLTVTIALNYGGRLEIVDAVKRLVEAGVPAAKVTERVISANLYDSQMPDPDLVVRTSGERRISNFLLWELAYSELVFTDVLWPDFRRDHLRDAVRDYQSRDRRFGALTTPVPVDAANRVGEGVEPVDAAARALGVG